jgi:acyl-coenzyme A thioesterase PaaI-like protein
MHLEEKQTTPEMVAIASPPPGFIPIISTSPFGWANGPIFERKDESGCARGFRIAERHINAGGVLHGGMVMTFADIVLAQATSTVLDGPFVTARLTTDFIGPGFLGDWVEGEGDAWLSDDDIAVVRARITSQGKLIATAQGFFKAIRRRKAAV